MPKTNPEQVIDLSLSQLARKKFRFDNDDNRVVYINTSDMNILDRISQAYPKLQEEQEKYLNLTDGINLNETDTNTYESIATLATRLKDIDKSMRDLLDFIFDAPVSQATAPEGSMYDPFNGSFRYEIILELLITQCTDNLQKEFKQMVSQIEKHTKKYTKKGN